MSEEEPAQPATAGHNNTSDRYLAFSLQTEQYAIPLLQVREVIGMREPTPIPKTPSYVKGIISLREQVISVIDLRTKLELAKHANGPETSIIILDLAPLLLGVLVDSINSVLELGAADLNPAPDAMPAKDPYVAGVARKDNRLTLILDIKSMLSGEDLAVLKRNHPNQAA